MSGLRQARNHLQTEYHRLHDQWLLTSASWRDIVRRRFEREYWQEYEQSTWPALQEMDRLDAIIAQARREIR